MTPRLVAACFAGVSAVALAVSVWSYFERKPEPPPARDLSWQQTMVAP